MCFSRELVKSKVFGAWVAQGAVAYGINANIAHD